MDDEQNSLVELSDVEESVVERYERLSDHVEAGASESRPNKTAAEVATIAAILTVACEVAESGEADA